MLQGAVLPAGWQHEVQPVGSEKEVLLESVRQYSSIHYVTELNLREYLGSTFHLKTS